MKTELYIHIPFCIKKCNYCDFLSLPVREEAVLFCYMDALHKEIRQTAGQVGMDLSVQSIFIGGGTPSVLPEGSVAKLLEVVRDNFPVREDAEISLESNPGTLGRRKLEEYRHAGINRLSIGLQSPDDALLGRLGRIHDWEDFYRNYVQAREAGFDNINIDLMSGLPGQTLSSYEEGLHKVLGMKPDHISSYSLILEEGTPFYGDPTVARDLPNEETDRDMYHRTKAILREYGYHRYEISNYALKGKECVHNLGYWTGIPYLGFGPGAASYWKEAGKGRPTRFSNVRNLDMYMAKPFIPPEEREDYEVLSPESCMEEYMFLGLRKMEGVSIQLFEENFHLSMEEVYGDVLDRYQAAGLLEKKGDFLRLTEEGIDVSDYIFADFML